MEDYDDDDVLSVIAKLIWPCEMWLTSECDTLLYDAKIWCRLICERNSTKSEWWFSDQ